MLDMNYEMALLKRQLLEAAYDPGQTTVWVSAQWYEPVIEGAVMVWREGNA